MTRFARAHGSKASNERQPEEATSWNVLKQQLLEQQAASKQKVDQASTPTRQPFVFQKSKSEVTEWAEFEDVPDSIQKKKKKKEKLGMPGEKKLDWAEFEDVPDSIQKKKKKKEKLGMSGEKSLDRFDEQHSSKSKLHKIKNDSNIKHGKSFARKLKKIKGLEEASKPSRQPAVFQTNNIELTQCTEFEEVLHPKVKKLAKKKEKLGMSVKKLVDRLSCDEQHSSKSNMHKIEHNGNIQNSKTLAKKIKKIKVKGQTQYSGIPEGPEPVISKAKPKVKLSKREKRKNKLKVFENSVENFNPDSLDEHKERLTLEPVDGSERKLTKKQLKRKRQMLKKQQDNGFVSKRALKVDAKKKTKQLLESRNKEECEPQLIKQEINNKKSSLKKQLSSTLSDAPTNDDVETTDQTTSNSKLQVQSKRQKRNLKKLADPTKVKAHRRRKPRVESTTLVLNGREVEVTTFDGFPVRKEDADRLKELRKQMIANGIPHEETVETMKLERRKAEKALSRERNTVCFHCRKGGHNLSDCPELLEGSNQDAVPTSGICFKCGSTEHTHFECRVVRGQEFRFAKCFICREEGHISRQCPDNPRGLYPKGGSCKVCGDVTHLKKDCPDLQVKKEQNVITVDTVRSDRLEALDEDLRVEDNRPAVLPQKSKTVKF